MKRRKVSSIANSLVCTYIYIYICIKRGGEGEINLQSCLEDWQARNRTIREQFSPHSLGRAFEPEWVVVEDRKLYKQEQQNVSLEVQIPENSWNSQKASLSLIVLQ